MNIPHRKEDEIKFFSAITEDSHSRHGFLDAHIVHCPVCLSPTYSLIYNKKLYLLNEFL
jgi:hypothetical protein